jgi:hypothetical protein
MLPAVHKPVLKDVGLSVILKELNWQHCLPAENQLLSNGIVFMPLFTIMLDDATRFTQRLVIFCDETVLTCAMHLT